ncbi:MAG: hypothetical protein JNN02_02470 [Tabrizicola sp.]|nr:hypothetical protein [Tabrizicola sp.]
MPEDDWPTNVSVGSPDRPQDARMTRHICADTQLDWYDPRKDLPTLVVDEADHLIGLLREELRPGA